MENPTSETLTLQAIKGTCTAELKGVASADSGKQLHLLH